MRDNRTNDTTAIRRRTGPQGDKIVEAESVEAVNASAESSRRQSRSMGRGLSAIMNEADSDLARLGNLSGFTVSTVKLDDKDAQAIGASGSIDVKILGKILEKLHGTTSGSYANVPNLVELENSFTEDELKKTFMKAGFNESELTHLKPITLEYISKLVDEGIIRLDSPVGKINSFVALTAEFARALAPHLATPATPSPQPRLQLSEPAGNVAPYEGKKASGPVDAFLRVAYPARKIGKPLSVQYLRQHDPRALKAYYKLDHEARQALGIRTESDDGDDLLAHHRIDLADDQGVDEAKQLYSLLQYRLYRKI